MPLTLNAVVKLIHCVRLRHFAFFLGSVLVFSQLCLAQDAKPANWFQFRGPQGDGTAPGQQPPTQWSQDENIRWKTEIHGRGWSSPVVLGDEVWLTTATLDGKEQFVLCVDLASGKIKHDKLIFENVEVQKDHHETNTYASPTPILDEQFVFVHFGSYGTACLRRDTCEVVWQRRDLPCNHFRGPGSSPILYKNLLIFHQDGFDFQYVVALDRQTGNTVWKADRNIEYGTDNGDYYKAFCTPIIIDVAGQKQLISPTSKACLALDPETGKEIWRVRYQEFSATARPLFDGSRLYINTGFGKAQLYCVEVDGKGDITDSDKVVWTQRKGIGSKPSQILVGGRLFGVTDDGILARISTENGEIVWQDRLGGKFSASLVATDEYLYAFDHDGKGYVYAMADEPKQVSINQLPNGCNASPAIVQDSLIVRTTTHLYRIAK
jgi:outer membrane protein assembly factor BamB